jgi:small subunit ribosomal protein S1
MSDIDLSASETTLPTPTEPTAPEMESAASTALSEEPLEAEPAASAGTPVELIPSEQAPIDPKIDEEMAAEIDEEAVEDAVHADKLRVVDVEREAAVTTNPEPRIATAEPEVEPAAEPEESFGAIFSEFQRTHARRDGNSQIRGTIVAVTADSVLVDIGFKSEGILPLATFPKDREAPKPGDSLQVSVKGRDEDGYYSLSLFRTAVPKDWTSLERAFQEKSTIVGTVSSVVKGGVNVDVGVRAFLPASRSGARDAAEMEKLVGQEIRVRITKLDVQDENVVVDRRGVTEEEALATRTQRYAEVREGAVVDGTVRSIAEYGAFVDLGGVDGLLHISDVAWSRVAKVEDVLSVGQQLEVKVLKIDPEGKRISLGLKQLQAHPWDGITEKYSPGERVRGVVTRIAEFGAFVELSPGVEGLVHLSEMSWSKRIHKATEVVNVGDAIEAVILTIDVPERRISLGLKQALGDPWATASARLAPGSIVEGPIASITKFGAFVQVAEGVEGLVHISEIVADRRLNHPSDVLRVGQPVRAMVLEVDKEKRQLKLSIKQLIPTGLDEFLAEHSVGDEVTGRIASIDDSVAKVEVGEGVFCSCKLPVQTEAAAASVIEAPAAAKVDLSALSSMLKSKWKTGAAAESSLKTGAANTANESAAPGQVRRFRIARLDAQTKLIGLELIQ